MKKKIMICLDEEIIQKIKQIQQTTKYNLSDRINQWLRTELHIQPKYMTKAEAMKYLKNLNEPITINHR